MFLLWPFFEKTNGRTSINDVRFYGTLQSRTGPVQGQNRVFPVKFFSQGKTCFHYRGTLFSLFSLFLLQGFPSEKNFTGKTLFSLQGMGLQCIWQWDKFLTFHTFNITQLKSQVWNFTGFLFYNLFKEVQKVDILLYPVQCMLMNWC